jgi:hypothetical protein
MNMHVSPEAGDQGAPGVPGRDPRRDAVVRRFLKDADTVSLGSEDLRVQRPGNRAIIAARLEMIWGACEPHVRGVDDNGDEVLVDFRYVDLAARVLDRLGRVLQVDREDPPAPGVEVVDRDPNAVVVSRELDALEARMAGGAEGTPGA